MEIQMYFKHMDSSDAIRALAEDKSEKLKKYFRGKLSLTWNFHVERGLNIAHCQLFGNNMDFFAEARCSDMRDSIEEVVERLEAQLRKFKEIVTDHHRGEDPEKNPSVVPGNRKAS